MAKDQTIFLFFLIIFSCLPPLYFAGAAQPLKLHHHAHPHRPPPPSALRASDKFEGSSNLVRLRYHMGPVLSSPINIYLIWYGHWAPQQQLLLKDFLLSISPSSSAPSPSPSVSDWWRTVALYTDQTGANVSRTVLIAGEFSDAAYSHGRSLTRLSIQQVIANAVSAAAPRRLPVDHRNGIYLVLTSPDVAVQDFCRAVCGFHYFTFPSLVGFTVPYAWIGNSGKQCPDVCAYPFAVPSYMAGGGTKPLAPPNGDVGVDGMISVIGHELAELSSNPLVNAWYAGEDPTAPTEIGDLCEGLYGTGGGGGFIGQVMSDKEGRKFNMNGRNGRRFLVQWIWSPVLQACAGPNALD
ncbi:Protein EXORDIUM-like 5 [Asimina triloba]